MNLKELMDILDIEEPEEFEYFENFADLVENENNISDEILFQLFKKTDFNNIAEIIQNYFEDIMNNIPDSIADFYTLMDTIKRVLVGLMASNGDDNTVANFAEEVNRFRKWYSIESKVECVNIKTEEKTVVSIRDAIVNAKLEALNGDKYRYDFSDCLDYELDEFIMRYGSISVEEEENLEDESLIDNGYVYDDEMKGL